MCGLFNLEVWDNEAEYLVIDDFDFDFFPGMRKALWGAQKEFTAVDKFKRKRRILWGKPMIWLCNEEGSPFNKVAKDGNYLLRGTELEWYRANCVEVAVSERMY